MDLYFGAKMKPIYSDRYYISKTKRVDTSGIYINIGLRNSFVKVVIKKKTKRKFSFYFVS